MVTKEDSKGQGVGRKIRSLGLTYIRAQSCPWTVAHKDPLSMEFSRQEYWSGLPFPSPGNLPDPGMKPVSPAFQTDSLLSEPPEKFRYLLAGKNPENEK